MKKKVHYLMHIKYLPFHRNISYTVEHFHLALFLQKKLIWGGGVSHFHPLGNYDTHHLSNTPLQVALLWEGMDQAFSISTGKKGRGEKKINNQYNMIIQHIKQIINLLQIYLHVLNYFTKFRNLIYYFIVTIQCIQTRYKNLFYICIFNLK